MMEEHRYSTFTLDLHWLFDEPRDPELARHVAECDRCGAYVEQLSAVAARPFVLRVKRRWYDRWWPALALAAAATVVALVVLLRPSGSKPAYVAAKGAPAVLALVHRGGTTTVWDASMRIRDRDALALRVACEAMTNVSVLVADHGRWRAVFAGHCRDDVLPFTLAVDAEPGDERIAVVISMAPLDEAAAQRAADDLTRNATVWALELDFAKEIAQ